MFGETLKSFHPPMRSSDSFQAKRTQLRLFKEARRKTNSSFYDGERRHRPKHSLKMQGNGCCNLHHPLDLKRSGTVDIFRPCLTSECKFSQIPKQLWCYIDFKRHWWGGSCKLKSDILNVSDERIRPSLLCFFGAIKNGQKRNPGMISCDETSFTSIDQGSDVMDSMVNGYSISVVTMNVDSHGENEHSWTENSLTSTFRYLEEIMAEAIQLVALNATGARENDPANQTVEKTGIQEETGDVREAEAAVTQPIHEANTQGESAPSNETTIEAERQPMATLIRESPRPVCSHYQRRCLVRFPWYGKFSTCPAATTSLIVLRIRQEQQMPLIYALLSAMTNKGWDFFWEQNLSFPRFRF